MNCFKVQRLQNFGPKTIPSVSAKKNICHSLIASLYKHTPSLHIYIYILVQYFTSLVTIFPGDTNAFLETRSDPRVFFTFSS
jgi:hypothetical protein